MKKNIGIVLKIELIMLIFIIMLKIVVINHFPYLYNYINMFFWLILAIVLYFMFGFFKDKHYLKGLTIRYIIISLLSYLIFVYLLGLFTGFTTNVFSKNIINVLENIFIASVFIISKEFVRYVLCKKSGNNIKLVIFLTIIYIIFNIIMSINAYNFEGFKQIFMYTFVILIPIITKECLCTYITYNISLIPTIIYVLAFEIYIYIFPILPDVGNYIIAVLGLLFPYIIYTQISKILKYNEKSILPYKKNMYQIVLIPIMFFLITTVVLVSGLFSHKMIAIGSNSMNPIYYLGDAVIYKKIEAKDVKEDDILVFEHNGVVVTHRVKQVIKENNVLQFKTKGDNNKKDDNFLVNEEDVLGTVKYIVKYIGYPTIWLNELF